MKSRIQVVSLVVLAAFALGPSLGMAQGRAALKSLSANNGLYGNTIVDMTFPTAFTEVCIKHGAIAYDQHMAGESTLGGNCLPNDVGWVIEREQRPRLPWEQARMECLLIRMRLPEIFEWKFSCVNAADLGLNDMTSDTEWASNIAKAGFNSDGSWAGVGAAAAGFSNGVGSCDIAGIGWVGVGNGGAQPWSYRCVR